MRGVCASSIAEQRNPRPAGAAVVGLTLVTELGAATAAIHANLTDRSARARKRRRTRRASGGARVDEFGGAARACAECDERDGEERGGEAARSKAGEVHCARVARARARRERARRRLTKGASRIHVEVDVNVDFDAALVGLIFRAVVVGIHACSDARDVARPRVHRGTKPAWTRPRGSRLSSKVWRRGPRSRQRQRQRQPVSIDEPAIPSTSRRPVTRTTTCA